MQLLRVVEPPQVVHILFEQHYTCLNLRGDLIDGLVEVGRAVRTNVDVGHVPRDRNLGGDIERSAFRGDEKIRFAFDDAIEDVGE